MSGRGELGCDVFDEGVGAIPPRGVNGISVNDVDDEPSGIDPRRADQSVGPIDEDCSVSA